MDISDRTGLSEEEARSRLRSAGPNELPASRRPRFGQLALEVLLEPMSLLLLASGGIYLSLGNRQEAFMLLSFVFVLLGITVFQQNKTERSLEALRDLSSPRASVIRNGKQRRIPGREVVPGDVVILSEGDRVPADGVLLDAVSLLIDESLLTGESISVRKALNVNDTVSAVPGGDDLPFVFSGTLVVRGQGIFEVQTTGIRTEMGKIGKRLQDVERKKTFLQRETHKWVVAFVIAGGIICLVLIIVYGLTRGHWLEGVLAGITLAMAMIPEEFPVVLTVFMALGAWRLSRQNVLTRRIPAIETLGAATVLCVDKTGTLTRNRMNVDTLVAHRQCCELSVLEGPIPEEFHETIEFSILASQRDPFDPMEIAFRELGEHYLANTEHLHADWELVQEYPLTAELLAMSRVWRSVDRSEYVIAAKGSPEAILDLCHVEPEVFERQMAIVEQLAIKGLRVVGTARASFRPSPLPEIQHGFAFEFLGFVALSDPVRPDAVTAVKECDSAGIRVVMITGDYPQTAQSIARQVGLLDPDAVVRGADLLEMTDEELQAVIQTVNVFARVAPEQKLRLVNALKANGEVVAMTGDGVNDAPALKAAHIGLAMGGRGTDVAREASDLVLTTDDFSCLVQAVKMGRRIFDNLRRAISYILAIHIPIAGMSLIPVLLKWPLIPGQSHEN
jgi:P-type Ca2+ transporter type 2C